MDYMIEDLMEEVVERGGSDLHVSAGLPPYIRINGKLTPTEYPPLTAEQCQRLIFSMLNNTQRKKLEQTWELDCSYGVRGLARFRVNVYKDRGTYAAALLGSLWIFGPSLRLCAGTRAYGVDVGALGPHRAVLHVHGCI